MVDYVDLVSEFFDFDDTIRMYRRFAVEANKVLAGYPGVAAVLR